MNYNLEQVFLVILMFISMTCLFECQWQHQDFIIFAVWNIIMEESDKERYNGYFYVSVTKIPVRIT
jgi:hypothetical protein